MLNKNDKLLLEAIKTMLNQGSKLGLSMHDELEQNPKGVGYLHEQINDMFHVKAAELIHANSICQAFAKVHGYKQINDNTFAPALEREMLSTAVPAEERTKSIRFIEEILKEFRTEQQEWAERDGGFNPKLDEINDISRPAQPLEFDIQNRQLNKRNIDKVKPGDGSPARTNNGHPPLPGDGYDAEINE